MVFLCPVELKSVSCVRDRRGKTTVPRNEGTRIWNRWPDPKPEPTKEGDGEGARPNHIANESEISPLVEGQNRSGKLP